MKPVEATLEGRGVRRGGGTLSHLSYWNLLHIILDAAAFWQTAPERLSNFSCFTAGCRASGPPGPPWTLLDRLDPP